MDSDSYIKFNPSKIAKSDFEGGTEVEADNDFHSVERDNTAFKRVLIILNQALPASIGSVIFVMQMTVNLIFIGRLNQPALIAGVGMGNVIANILCLAIVIGFNQALDTLIS